MGPHLHADGWRRHVHLHVDVASRGVHADVACRRVHVHVDRRRRNVVADVDLRRRRHVHLDVHAHSAHRNAQASQRDLKDLHRHDDRRPVGRRFENVIDGHEGEDEDGLLDDGQVGAASAGCCEVGLNHQVVNRMQPASSGCWLDVSCACSDLTVEDLH